MIIITDEAAQVGIKKFFLVLRPAQCCKDTLTHSNFNNNFVALDCDCVTINADNFI